MQQYGHQPTSACVTPYVDYAQVCLWIEFFGSNPIQFWMYGTAFCYWDGS